MTRMSTREKLRTVAREEGWKLAEKPNPWNETWVRGDLLVTIGFDKRGSLRWCALMRNTEKGVEPLARYGLFAREEVGTGGGEIALRVAHKAAIVRTWLERGDGA